MSYLGPATEDAKALLTEGVAESGKRQALEKENRLLRACIEKQQAQLVAADAALERGHPELVLIRELARDVKTVVAAVSPYASDGWRNGGSVMRAEDADALHRIARDWVVKVAHLEASPPCPEPGCVRREPLHRYVAHIHADGYRQWVTVATSKGQRRFKRGSW